MQAISFAAHLVLVAKVSATAAGHGFIGLTFSAADANHFYVAAWKAAKSGGIDGALDDKGYYGTYQGYSVVIAGNVVSYFYYATAGLTLKKFVTIH